MITIPNYNTTTLTTDHHDTNQTSYRAPLASKLANEQHFLTKLANVGASFPN